MIVRRPLKAAAKPAIGRATSSSANAHGLCSSCMSESRGSRLPRGSQGKPPQKPSQRCSRCSVASISSAKIHHFRQRHRLRPARLAQDHARYDDLVLRRLCLMAKRRHRKRQWTLTSMAAAPPGYRPDIRPRHPRDRPHDQPHPPKMPRVQDAIPSLDCRAWKGRSNPLLLNALRFATESRVRPRCGWAAWMRNG